MVVRQWAMQKNNNKKCNEIGAINCIQHKIQIYDKPLVLLDHAVVVLVLVVIVLVRVPLGIILAPTSNLTTPLIPTFLSLFHIWDQTQKLRRMYRDATSFESIQERPTSVRRINTPSCVGFNCI